MNRSISQSSYSLTDSFFSSLLGWKDPFNSKSNSEGKPISNESEKLWPCLWDVRVERMGKGTCPWSSLFSQTGQVEVRAAA